MATATAKLENILCDIYGVGAVHACPTTVLWAADRIDDVETAKKELRRINRLREKHGAPLAYPPYGSRLF